MFKYSFTEIIRSLMVTLLCLIFVFSIDSIIYPGTHTNILKNPISLFRNLPLVALSYFFLNEIILLLSRKSSNQEFIWDKNGFVFNQNCFIWIAILETRSLNKIRKTELQQLSHLKLFSLELDIKKTCLRVFLYAKSNEELKKIIRRSKPILDVVLPDLKILIAVDSLKLFDKTSFEKIGNIDFLTSKNQLFILNFDNIKANSISYSDRVTFSFFSAIKDEKMNNVQSQWYSLDSLSQNSFFNSLGAILTNYQKRNYFQILRKKNNLERTQIRYQIEEQEKHSFQEGIIQFEKCLSFLLSQTKPELDLMNEGLKHSIKKDNVISIFQENKEVNEKILHSNDYLLHN